MSYQQKATTAEIALLEMFRQRQGEIVAYKNAHGGDLEGAFQKVTGVPWPQNRSVKLSNGQPEITGDRTFKSVMGRYVLPIAGAVAAPFVLPALAGAIGGGAAAAGGTGAAEGVAGVAGALGGGGGIGSAAAATSAAATAAKVAKGVMSTSQVARDVMGMGGEMLGGAAEDAAYNRGNQFEANLASGQLAQQAERDYNTAMLQREQQGRANRNDAWSRMLHANYVANADGSTPGFSPYSKPIAAPSAETKAAALAARADAERRLANPYADMPEPRRVGDDVSLAGPGGWERAANVAAPIAGVASRIPLSVWQKLGRFIR